MAKQKGGAAAKKEPKARKPRAKAPTSDKPEAQSTASAASAAPSANLPHQYKLPATGIVERLAKALDSMKGDIQETTRAMGERVAKAVETQHVDKKALALVRSLRQLHARQPAQFAITFTHLLYYMDDMKFAELADAARGLAINGEDDDGEGDDGQTDLEDAVTASTDDAPPAAPPAETPPDEQPATGKSPALEVVPKAPQTAEAA